MSRAKKVSELLDMFKDQLKGAGDTVLTGARKLDEGYSNKIAEMYEGANPAVQAAAYTIGGAGPSLRKFDVEIADNPKLQELMSYAIPAANAVPKYALPAAGVTLAGKALLDVASAINSQLGDGQEQGQINMYS